MPTYWFVAKDKDSHGNPLPPLPAGHPERFVFLHPSRDGQEVIRWVKAQGIGSPNRAYAVWRLEDLNLPEPRLLCVQPSYGEAGQPNAQYPVTSPQHINGGQPYGGPQSAPGQNRANGTVDRSGFQSLGDAVLSGTGDGFFTESPDMGGTYTDLVNGGREEIPRRLPS